MNRDAGASDVWSVFNPRKREIALGAVKPLPGVIGR